MKNTVARLSSSVAEIEEFVGALRSIRSHRISKKDFSALRRGEYLTGPGRAGVRRISSESALCSDRFSHEEWEEARLALEALEKDRNLAEALEALQRERREAHIDALIAESFSTASEAQQQRLASEIDRYAASDRLGELQQFLEDVGLRGLKEALKRREHGGRSTLWAYSVPGMGALLEVLVAVRILMVVASGFQTIVISLLLIMYAAIAHKIQALEYGMWFFGLDMQRSFHAVYRRMSHRWLKIASDDRGAPEAVKNLRRSAINTLVSSCRSTALVAIALWELARSLK